MEISKQKNIFQELPGGDHYAGVYIVLNYDPTEFGGNEDIIKDAALDKILETRPDLVGLISKEDLSNVREDNAVGEISLRATGDEFVDVLMRQQGGEAEEVFEELPIDEDLPEITDEEVAQEVEEINEIDDMEIIEEGPEDIENEEGPEIPEELGELEAPEEVDDMEIIEEEPEGIEIPEEVEETDDMEIIEEEPEAPEITEEPEEPEEAKEPEESQDSLEGLEEVMYEEINMGGTTTAVGEVRFDREVDVERGSTEAIKFIESKHPELNVTEDALDTSKIDSGIIGFMVGVTAPSEISAENNFKVTEAEAEDTPTFAQSNQYQKEASQINKVDKAFTSFMDGFTFGDLSKANQDLQDMLVVAQFDSTEKIQFLSKVRDGLRSDNITLDFLES